MQLLDGQLLAKTMRAEIADQVRQHVSEGGRVPGLATVLVGDHPASAVYVRNKRKACEAAGMTSAHHALPGDVTQDQLLHVIADLNADPHVHGILVQLPLPKQIEESVVIRSINPLKDVDAFHPENVGLLMTGHPRFSPCTPFGIQQLLSRNHIATAGKHVVVLGRSNIVGKPIAMMMMQKPSSTNPYGGDATVTVVHRGTRDLPSITRQADILIAAIGVPHFLTREMVKVGAVVIDVGINSVEGKIVGDVATDVAEVAGALSPVPGGVGPMTITMLLHNTLVAARIVQTR